MAEDCEKNPYLCIDLTRNSSIAAASKMKSWFRNVMIVSNGDVYMSSNMLVFLIWLWQVTRTDEGKPFRTKPGWLQYPFSLIGINQWIQEILKFTWPPQSSSAMTLVTAATQERADLRINRGGGRHCRDELPFRGLKLTKILRDSPMNLQTWIRDLVQDHPPPVAFAIAGIRMSQLSGLAGKRRADTRANAHTIGKLAEIDPLRALIKAHILQGGESLLGSQNFPSMFERFWRNQPGGLSERRRAQLVDVVDFPVKIASMVIFVIDKIWSLGTVDLQRLPWVTIARFRRWLSSCWIKTFQTSRSSPCVSIEKSITVFRSPALVDVLAALERGDMTITLLPAIIDTVADVKKLVDAALMPGPLSWIKTGDWIKPGDRVQTGTASVKVVSTAREALTWSDLRQYVVAEVKQVAVVFRPSRAVHRFRDQTAACEYDLAVWTEILKHQPIEGSEWLKSFVPIGSTSDWSDRPVRLLGTEDLVPITCDYDRAKAAVAVCNELTSVSLDATMKSTEPFTANQAEATRERTELNEPAAKRRRVFTEASE